MKKIKGTTKIIYFFCVLFVISLNVRLSITLIQRQLLVFLIILKCSNMSFSGGLAICPLPGLCPEPTGDRLKVAQNPQIF